MALFDHREHDSDVGVINAGAVHRKIHFNIDIEAITHSDILFQELQSTKDIPSQFLPQDKEHCFVISYSPNQGGELPTEIVNNINGVARAHIEDSSRARWLLVHTHLSNSVRPQSTLVCFLKHVSPNAFVDNAEGAGVANQVMIALQALQEEGLVTTNVNYELIRKMSSRFGVLFGGSFAEVANSLRVHSIEQSVQKNEKVAMLKGLLDPVLAPTSSLSLSGTAHQPEVEDEIN